MIPPPARRAARRLVRKVKRQVSIRVIPAGSSVVLGYHGVAEASFDPWDLSHPPDIFREHLEAIVRYFRPVSLEELVEAARRGAPLRRAVAITFDDGYRNLLDGATQALEHFGVPATVFVVSGYVDSGRDFWWEALSTIAFSPRRPTAGAEHLDGLAVEWSLDAEPLYLALYDQLQPYSHERRTAVLDELATRTEPDPAKPQTMSAKELLELASSGLVEIGSHTVWHPRLPDLDRAQQLDEMRHSRTNLEQILGRPVTSFAFPHGAFTDEGITCAQEAGYTRVCTSAHAAVRAEPDTRAIPRCFVYAKWHGDKFAWQLSRYFRLAG